MLHRSLLAALILAFASGVARANSCSPARPALTPPFSTTPVMVGRLCTITIDNPTGNDRNDPPLPVTGLMIRSQGHDLTFTTAGPTPITGGRFYGCDPPMLTDQPTPYPFQRTVLAPVDPLPARQTIEVAAGTQVLVTFTTTDALDRENCNAPAQPFAGFCQPPLDECMIFDAGPPLAPDSAAPFPATDAGSPMTDTAIDAGGPATDAAATAIDATIIDATAGGAESADAAPAAKAASKGCSLGERGDPGALGILALAMLTLQRRQRRATCPARRGSACPRG